MPGPYIRAWKSWSETRRGLLGSCPSQGLRFRYIPMHVCPCGCVCWQVCLSSRRQAFRKFPEPLAHPQEYLSPETIRMLPKWKSQTLNPRSKCPNRGRNNTHPLPAAIPLALSQRMRLGSPPTLNHSPETGVSSRGLGYQGVP